MLANPCPNRTPVPGTVRKPNPATLEGKFFRLRGKSFGDCPCGRTGLTLNASGNLPPHNKPAD